MGVEIQNKRIRILILSLAQELRTTIDKIQKYILHQFYILNFAFSYVMNTNLCQYPFFISTRQHFKTTYFSIDFPTEQTGYFIILELEMATAVVDR